METSVLILFQALTISGDGMTIKHLNIESKHGLLLSVPTYSPNPHAPLLSSIPTQQFFGINAAVDHTSETQLQGWLDLVTCLYETYNASPLGQRKPLNQREFYRFTAGMNTDHAEDQKKLAHLFKTYKEFIE